MTQFELITFENDPKSDSDGCSSCTLKGGREIGVNRFYTDQKLAARLVEAASLDGIPTEQTYDDSGVNVKFLKPMPRLMRLFKAFKP